MSGQVLYRSAGCSLVPSPWSAQGTKTARNGSDLMRVMTSVRRPDWLRLPLRKAQHRSDTANPWAI